MSPRTGRPKTDSPKSVDVKVRLDEKTNKLLQDFCEKNGLKRAEAIRLGIEKLVGK